MAAIGELEQLYERHIQALYAFVLNLTRDEADSDQRAVVHLKLWEELTFEQIGQTLGISSNTAASRYRYGVDKLRFRLRPLYNEIL